MRSCFGTQVSSIIYWVNKDLITMRMILRHRRLCQCHFFIIVVADKPVCEKSSSVAVGVSRKRVSKVKSRTFWKILLNSKCIFVSQQSLSRKHVSKVRFCWNFLVTFPPNQKCNRQWRCENSLKNICLCFVANHM